MSQKIFLPSFERNHRYLQGFYLSAIYLFFYLPILILIIYSFNDSIYSVHWHSFTFKWYRQLFQASDLWVSAKNSISISLLAASVATVLGTLIAIVLNRYRFLGRKLLYSLLFVLIVSPDIVMGIALLMLFSMLHLALGFITLFLAHVTLCVPFVAVVIYSRMSYLDKNLFEAARDLGANERVIISQIILPLIWPAILSAWLLSFSLSFDDIIISYFVTGPTFTILPLSIFSMVRLGVKPEINALCTLVFSTTFILALLAHRFLPQNYRR